MFFILQKRYLYIAFFNVKLYYIKKLNESFSISKFDNQFYYFKRMVN